MEGAERAPGLDLSPESGAPPDALHADELTPTWAEEVVEIVEGFEAAEREFEQAAEAYERQPTGRGFYRRLHRRDRAAQVLMTVYRQSHERLLAIENGIRRQVEAEQRAGGE